MNQNKAPWYYLLLLILAGESIFILPFVLVRVFRPTVMDSFGIDNTQVGFCFSVYGIVALVSYLFGGVLADRYPPRKLIAVALWLTAAGGLVFANFPSYTTLKMLYGYWGFTTIFLFWAAMIKATRVWGGTKSQGKAFGFLDGGRGLVGALFGTLGVFIFSIFLISEAADASIEESKEALKYVVLVSSGIVFFVGILVWLFLKLDKEREEKLVLDKISVHQIVEVLKLPSVLLLMIIILCAYFGYKITDFISLYAKEVMLYDKVESAQAGTSLLFIRPIVGILIGIVADKTQTTFWLFISFVVSLIGALLFASGIVVASSTLLFIISVITIATGVYAARSLYFAVMEKGRIPLALTGTAVGLISLVGYTPDIFHGPVTGYLLDGSPGIAGHQHVFMLMAVFSCIGGVASWLYYRMYKNS